MHDNDPKFCIAMTVSTNHIMHIMAIHWVNCVSDIDECTESNGGCHHDCKNTVGSYHCLCQSGYILGADNHNCRGIHT